MSRAAGDWMVISVRDGGIQALAAVARLEAGPEWPGCACLRAARRGLPVEALDGAPGCLLHRGLGATLTVGADPDAPGVAGGEAWGCLREAQVALGGAAEERVLTDEMRGSAGHVAEVVPVHVSERARLADVQSGAALAMEGGRAIPFSVIWRPLSRIMPGSREETLEQCRV